MDILLRRYETLLTPSVRPAEPQLSSAWSRKDMGTSSYQRLDPQRVSRKSTRIPLSLVENQPQEANAFVSGLARYPNNYPKHVQKSYEGADE